MKTKLIEAIRETITDLKENRREYNWMDMQHCNCGILAQNICGLSSSEVYRLQNDSVGIWCSQAQQCSKTGMPINKIFEKFFEVGLTADDIVELEGLSNLEICNRLGWEVTRNSCGLLVSNEDDDGYTKKENFILYLETWLEILLEEGKTEPEVIECNLGPALESLIDAASDIADEAIVADYESRYPIVSEAKPMEFTSFERMNEEQKLLYQN